MRRIISSILLSLSIILLSAECMAQDAPSRQQSIDLPLWASMHTVAGQLVKYGYAEHQALPLIQAADIYNTFVGGTLNIVPENNPDTFSSEDKNEDNANPDSIAMPNEWDVTTDIDALLQDASVFADGNAALLELIDGIRRNRSRGPTSSQFETTRNSIGAHSTDNYKIKFQAGKTAVVAVTGNGKTDLDIFVYNSKNRIVAIDSRKNSDDCVVVWNPATTDTYTIKVKNYGKINNKYTMSIQK